MNEDKILRSRRSLLRISPGDEEVVSLSRITKFLGRGDLDCDQVRGLSSEYLDDGLPPSRLQRFRAHISNCGPCKSFLDGLASTVSMLTSLPGATSPPTLKQSIIAEIRRGEERGETEG